MTLTFTTDRPPMRNDDRRTIGPAISQPAQSIASNARQIALVLTGMSASEQQIGEARANLVALALAAIDLAERL